MIKSSFNTSPAITLQSTYEIYRALAEVRKALGIPDAFARAIRDIKSPQQGFSLREVAELATQLGMPVQMAKWTDATSLQPN